MTRFARGTTWPLRRDGRGGYEAAEGLDKLRNNLEFLYAVRGSNDAEPGEIPWRPEFGTPLDRLVFEQGTPRTRALAEYYVREAVGRYEPRVRVVSATIEFKRTPEGNSLEIEVLHEIVALRTAPERERVTTTTALAS